ncbi:phage portal protein [Amycolatopsis minnesotensis]|uniref:Phage portal protein n=1 Tax=Amycolatopsis minnesotensis TaxID=337894 RepID=A0ABP5CIC8_9PSEU
MPFVFSQGVLESVHQYQTATIPVGGSIMLADGLAQDYATIWRTQPQVRTVVSFLARNIAQLGIHVYRRMSDVDRVRITDHPVGDLLSKPNPFTTRYRLIEALVSDLAIYDNAILAKVDTLGLVRLDPRYVTPISANQFTVETYRYRGTTGYRDLPAEQVIHFRGYNPEDGRWGCSPMETLRRTLSEEYQAGQYREQLWRNGARLMGYLKRPLDAPEWGEAARDRFRRSWQAQYTGTGAKAGGTPILEDGMDFVPASVTPEAAQYIEARRLTREEVAAAYHIPLPMVGILDHATFSNIQEQHKNLYQDTLGPWLTMMTEELHLQLLGDFEDSQDVYLEFNLAEKLRGSFEEQAAQLQTATGAPWMTRNEARARVNLPQLDGGDELVTPLNVLTGGQASPTDSAPEPKTVLATAMRLLEGVAG